MGLISLSEDFITNVGGMGALVGFVVSIFGALVALLHMILQVLRGE